MRPHFFRGTCDSLQQSIFSRQIARRVFVPIPAATRELCSTQHRSSGHNRWSKIKHDKAKVDAKVTKQRSQLSKEIELASKDGGPDPTCNPRLSSVLAAAKRAGFPKASCEAAIARGQGRSQTGVALESVVIEALHGPTGVAVIIDCMTDNKAKTLQDVREKLKLNGAAQAPTSYLFERRGRVSFSGAAQDSQSIPETDAVMEAALSAGAIDMDFPVDTDEVSVDKTIITNVIYTHPNQMVAVAEAMATELEMQPHEAELVWFPKPETAVKGSSGPDWEQLTHMVGQLEEDWSVTGVYINAR